MDGGGLDIVLVKEEVAGMCLESIIERDAGCAAASPENNGWAQIVEPSACNTSVPTTPTTRRSKRKRSRPHGRHPEGTEGHPTHPPDSSSTNQTRWSLKIFRDWLVEHNLSTRFESMEALELADVLEKFYGNIRKKGGESYSKSAYVGLRAGLHRYMAAPAQNCSVNIMHDPQFHSANNVFFTMLKKLKEEGQDTSKHKHPIKRRDFLLMYQSAVLGETDAYALQRKVFVEVGYYFPQKGREALRDLQQDSFVFRHDDQGREYVVLSKSLQSDGSMADKQPIMYSQPTSQFCPIRTLKVYLSKLNPECSAFFQTPKERCRRSEKVWFKNSPVGSRTLGDFMKIISTDAELSEIYTNHCLRITAAHALSKAGFDISDICGGGNQKMDDNVGMYSPRRKQWVLCQALHKYYADAAYDIQEQVDSKPYKKGTSTLKQNDTKPLIPSLNSPSSSSSLSDVPFIPLCLNSIKVEPGTTETTEMDCAIDLSMKEAESPLDLSIKTAKQPIVIDEDVPLDLSVKKQQGGNTGRGPVGNVHWPAEGKELHYGGRKPAPGEGTCVMFAGCTFTGDVTIKLHQ